MVSVRSPTHDQTQPGFHKVWTVFDLHILARGFCPRLMAAMRIDNVAVAASAPVLVDLESVDHAGGHLPRSRGKAAPVGESMAPAGDIVVARLVGRHED